MGRFTNGLIAGSILSAIGVGIAMSDKRTNRQISDTCQKVMNKANSMH